MARASITSWKRILEPAAGEPGPHGLQVGVMRGIAGAEYGDDHLAGDRAMCRVVEVPEHDAQMIAAAIVCVAIAVERRDVHEQPQRSRAGELVDAGGCPAQSRWCSRPRAARPPAGRALIDEARIERRLVVAGEDALQRGE